MKIPNTFGIDVEAAVFLEYGSVEELEKLIAAVSLLLICILAEGAICCLPEIMKE